MSTHGIQVDELGFGEAVKSISREINNHVLDVSERLRKGRALLGMMLFRVRDLGAHHPTKVTGSDMSDIEDMLQLAIEVLPHHDHDLADPVDGMDASIRWAIYAVSYWQHHTEVALEALIAASRADTSMADLTRLAQQMAEVVDGNEGLAQAWESFNGLVTSRGLEVEVKRSLSGALAEVSVLDAEALKKYRRTQRMAAEYMNALGWAAETVEADDAK